MVLSYRLGFDAFLSATNAAVVMLLRLVCIEMWATCASAGIVVEWKGIGLEPFECSGSPGKMSLVKKTAGCLGR